MNYVEVFPKDYGGNQDNACACYYYRQRPFTSDVQLVWKGHLVSSMLPRHAFVPRNRTCLVTVNSYSEDQVLNCVVIYGEDGRLIRKYDLSDLYSKEIITKYVLDNLIGSWEVQPEYRFLNDDKVFFVKSDTAIKPGEEMEGKVFRFDLLTGAMTRVPEAEAALKEYDPKDEGKPTGAYEARSYQYSLAFSSLTELLACKNSGVSETAQEEPPE